MNIFKLVHTNIEDSRDLIFKTALSQEELVRIIKFIQEMAVEKEDTFDLSSYEMFFTLYACGEIEPYPTKEEVAILEAQGEEYIDFIEVDLFAVWEGYNVKAFSLEEMKGRFDSEQMEVMEFYIEEFISETLAARK